MTTRNEDFLFAQEALALGYVTEAQVEEGFLLQRRMTEELKLDERLSVILVKRGFLAEEQARRVTSRLEPKGAREEIAGYRLVEKIGRGAMGTVYKAVHLGLHRVVAIKVLRKELAEDPLQVERLRSEAKLLASLDHPNIVRALDAGESGGFPFVVMEYVEGESLRDRIARRGPLPEEQALRITRALADALERARRMGVVHRDVKPGNVLIARSGEPKLMDLGLAKGPVDLGLTEHGATVGTPQYISPEQAQDPKKADTRSDIYSLGATLYAMLTGRPPFEGTTLAEILTKVLYETPTPPRVLNAEVSPETAYLIERMMLKDPSLRYHTPAEVVRDVDRILGGASIVPQGFTGSWEGYLLRRRTRRLAKVGLATVLGGVLVGTVVGLWVRHDREQRALAEAEGIVERALEDTTPERAEDELTVGAKRARLEEARRRVGDLEPPSLDRLRRRERELARTAEELGRWASLAPGLENLRREGRYDEALAEVEQFCRSVPGVDAPAELLARTFEGTLRAESEAALEALQREARANPAATWAEFLTGQREYRRRLDAGFARSPTLQRARDHARLSVEALERLDADVDRIVSDHAPSRIAARAEAFDLEGLLPGFASRRDALLSRAELAWKPLSEEGIPVAVVRERLAARLEEVEAGIHASVADAWRQAERSLGRDARSRDTGTAERALARLREIANALHAAGFSALGNEAWETRERLGASLLQTVAGARESYERVVEDLLRYLREGRRPEDLYARVDAALEDEGTNWPYLAEIRELRALPEGLAELYDLALDGLGERRRVGPVRLRDGSEDKRWDVVEVHEGERAVTVQVTRGGRVGPPERRTLEEVQPAQVVELARGSRNSLPPLSEAVALLAQFPEREAPDLRPVLDQYRRVRAALKGAGREGALAVYLGQREGEVAREQEAREENAYRDLARADTYVRLRSFKDALLYLDDLLKEDSPRRRTAYVEQNEQRIRQLMALVQGQLFNVALQKRFPGAAISGKEGVTTVTYDFETPEQLAIFRADPGRGWAVLERHVSPTPVTPEAVANERLHLLRGLEEELTRDRPLALPCPFDPAEPITVAFDLYTLKSPSFLAIDVDGLQVGILSLDPSSPAYAERFRFPEDVPSPERGERGPGLDFYGRGRGVAFHAGTDFGDPATWDDWKPESQGRHYESWAADGKRRKDLPGFLFGFEPSERGIPVKVVRTKGRLTLFVGGKEILSEERPGWAERGRLSDRDKAIRGGSGRLQILTWTPQAIDNLEISGVILDRWK